MRRFALAAVLLAATPSFAEPEVVTVGAWLRNVENVDLEHNAYNLSFVLWFRWNGATDPTRTYRFTNLLDAWALTAQPVFEEPQVQADGSKYQRFNVEGRFSHRFDLTSYPLDRQQFIVEIEDSRKNASELVFAADPASTVDPDLRVPGWDVGAKLLEVTRFEYPGAFGQGASLAHSRARFGLTLIRPPRLLMLTMLPPVLLVMLCCWAVFFLRPQHVDARVGTVITALLTVVFLQLAFTDDIPYLGVSVLLDQLFNFFLRGDDLHSSRVRRGGEAQRRRGRAA